MSGHTTYRSVIPTEQMPEDLRWNAATLWAGPKCHIVHYPLSGWKVFNLVVTYHNDAPEPVAGKPVSEEEVMQGFGHVHERARRTSSATAGTGSSGCCATASRSSAGSTAASSLLGDAAHPMLQYFAQGACMALEDAVCLSHMLAPIDDHASGARSLPRAARCCAPRGCSCSRAPSASTSTTRPARMREVRNAIMGRKTSEDYYGHLAWLYGGTGLEGAL